MHIMHVIDSLQLGGAERMLVELANAVASDGHRVSVCVTRSGMSLADDLSPAIPLHPLNRKRRFNFQAMRSFASIIRQQGVDLLHVHGRTSLSFVATVKSLRLADVAVVFHDHYGRIEHDSKIPFWFRSWAKFQIDYYVGVYARLWDSAIAAGLPREQVKVIDNALDLERLRKIAATSEQQVYVNDDKRPLGVVVANLRPEKGIHLLLSALSKISGPQPPWQIYIIGRDADSEYGKYCRKLTVELRISDRVHFLGERTDVPAWIQAADFAIIPSTSESGPLVLIEYMCLGIPFVATATGSISKRVAELGVPEIVRTNDVDALSAAIERLLQLSKTERKERGELGRTIAEQFFDIRCVLPQWYEVYESVLSQRQQ